ncbi:LPXTG cell wall anchor domain-containing protein [Longispora albida]|uniref:LPXTG cell wall anchor domain-containing protein n=1 Tax=Longispora albida TaxID=203523 RepID=UPI0003A738F0|nr:LPXTG cell wall anchor domain-containing protein [Longispora albida]
MQTIRRAAALALGVSAATLALATPALAETTPDVTLKITQYPFSPFGPLYSMSTKFICTNNGTATAPCEAVVTMPAGWRIMGDGSARETGTNPDGSVKWYVPAGVVEPGKEEERLFGVAYDPQERPYGKTFTGSVAYGKDGSGKPHDLTFYVPKKGDIAASVEILDYAKRPITSPKAGDRALIRVSLTNNGTELVNGAEGVLKINGKGLKIEHQPAITPEGHLTGAHIVKPGERSTGEFSAVFTEAGEAEAVLTFGPVELDAKPGDNVSTQKVTVAAAPAPVVTTPAAQPPAAPVAKPAEETLPKTGVSTPSIAALGVGLVAIGAGLVGIFGRRRRRDAHVEA